MTPRVVEFNKLLDNSVEDYEEGKKVFDKMALLWWNMNYEDHKYMKPSGFNPYFTKHQCSMCSSPLIYYLEKIKMEEMFGILYALCGVYRCVKCCKINWISDSKYERQIIDDQKFYKFAKTYQDME